jgi:hypothetical protein
MKPGNDFAGLTVSYAPAGPGAGKCYSAQRVMQIRRLLLAMAYALNSEHQACLQEPGTRQNVLLLLPLLRHGTTAVIA